MSDYLTEGEKVLAETGKTVWQTVLDEADIPEEHRAAVARYARILLNTSSGWRPSDAMRQAVRAYRRGGLKAVEIDIR